MPGRLQQRVAVITGSTAGIGLAIARVFAEEGARLVINGYPVQRGYELQQEFNQQGVEATFYEADVGRSEDLRQLIDHAVKHFGRLDILVNNAISGKSAAVVNQDETEWDRVFATSAKAVFLASQYAIPHMKTAGGGAIVNVASVHGLLGGRQAAAYDAAKGAIVNLTRQMAVDYGIDGIRVNALCPGRILTEAKQIWLQEHPEQIQLQKLAYPLGRPGTSREAALAALFLASDEASFVTGHALVVDGGLTAQLQDAVSAHVEQALRSGAAGAVDQ